MTALLREFMYNPHDTICAIATPPGESALAIVRISGKSSLNIVEKMFNGSSLEDHKAVYGELINNRGKPIDEVIAVYYKAPRSYTAEDMLEITCHGGYVVSNQVLSVMQEHGARLAEPGEFTVRAFLNGRIDLTSAEAVHSVISAKTEKSKSLAMNNLEGRLGEKLEKISSELVELITILEAEIDFGDEEVTKLDSDQVSFRIDSISTQISDVISTYDIGRVSEGRAQVAIVGAPNVGKSSLFNAILNNTRAIVTDKPGTTRDYLSEYVNIGGYPVILTDTAGIRPSAEIIEQEGIERTKRIIEESELCLFLLDVSREINEEDLEMEKYTRGRNVLRVFNKVEKSSPETKKSYFDLKIDGFNISALVGIGLKDLLEYITTNLLNKQVKTTEGVLLSHRQFSCAKAAKSALESAKSILSSGEPEEVYVGEIREALDQVGLITGKITSEDILNGIFSKFCIGK